MDNDKINEYCLEILEALGIGMKRMTEGKKTQMDNLRQCLEKIQRDILADRPIQAYIDKVCQVLEASNRKIAKDAPTVKVLASAMMNIDKINNKLSELSVDEYTCEEITKGSVKKVPIPEFRILKEQQEILIRSSKALGLNLDESIMEDTVVDDDELIKVSRDVANAEVVTIKVPESALK